MTKNSNNAQYNTTDSINHTPCVAPVEYESLCKSQQRQPKLLTRKVQLNKLIVTNNSRPDYLAIDIYWNTFRSLYAPKNTYEKNDIVLQVPKLKTKAIICDYAKLSYLHGCSKDTVRVKLVKLESLGLISRSFEHNSKSAGKVNQLVIYVWKDTPHFFNPYGINRRTIANLNTYTSYKYIEKKYNTTSPPQNLSTNTNQSNNDKVTNGGSNV